MRVVGQMLDLRDEAADGEIVEAAILEDPTYSGPSTGITLADAIDRRPSDCEPASRTNRAQRRILGPPDVEKKILTTPNHEFTFKKSC